MFEEVYSLAELERVIPILDPSFPIINSNDFDPKIYISNNFDVSLEKQERVSQLIKEALDLSLAKQKGKRNVKNWEIFLNDLQNKFPNLSLIQIHSIITTLFNIYSLTGQSNSLVNKLVLVVEKNPDSNSTYFHALLYYRVRIYKPINLNLWFIVLCLILEIEFQVSLLEISPIKDISKFLK